MRVYDDTVELDYQATARFFEGRGKRIAEVGALSAVLYQDKQPELAEQRSAHELSRLAPLLRQGRNGLRVLDVGCGTGRWAHELASDCKQFLGIDFCQDFLDEAQRQVQSLPQPQRFAFERVDLSQPLPAVLAGQRFDTILMAGVLIYLNDADARGVLDSLAGLLAPGGLMYLREPLGITQRLTLKEHFSDELAASYSSVYRARSEFDAWVDDCALRHGLQRVAADALYPAALDNRAETRQFFTLLKKGRA
jgi:2-polyprenyl-3-methyl-5-hydroxy-6-metoxy-1,4-benzoquinol methylase